MSNVTNMYMMFGDEATLGNIPYGSSDFNQPIGDWNVSSVTDMNGMFYNTYDDPQNTGAFNQPIGDWDVSSVTNMDFMFEGAYYFNQDISNWCVTNIPSEPYEFSYSPFVTIIESNMPVWGTCPSFGLDDQNHCLLYTSPSPRD